jgi:hypothetical protein
MEVAIGFAIAGNEAPTISPPTRSARVAHGRFWRELANSNSCSGKSDKSANDGNDNLDDTRQYGHTGHPIQIQMLELSGSGAEFAYRRAD